MAKSVSDGKEAEKSTEESVIEQTNISVSEACDFYGCDDLNKRTAEKKFSKVLLNLNEWKEVFINERITIKREK